MIFKKIYTFLNDRWNGNQISKFLLTLIFTTISCIFFFISEVKAVVVTPNAAAVAKSKADRDLAKASRLATTGVNAPPTMSYISSTATPPTGNNINEFHILYQKTGLNPVKIYTSYLPPKDSYNNNLVDEHTLEHCGVLGGEGFDMIGNSCMIKIPFDCSAPPRNEVASLGTNCLNYSALFRDAPTVDSKKLNPIECERTGGVDKTNCLSSQRPYCHDIGNPLIAINCKLAPCNLIPNQKYRRPGVNCLADCNDNTTNSISKPKFFIEGFNCLTSCKTKAVPKNIGENCVLEFNDYVMPLCNQQSASTKNFNKSVSNSGSRESCLDVIDLPLCSASAPASDELTKCVKPCASPNLVKHNVNCINFISAKSLDYNGYVDKSCHHYTDSATLNANPSCKKLDCHNLSDTELLRTLNAFNSTIDGFSTRKYCNPVKYTNFSINQFKAINDAGSNAYLRDYSLDNKPCYSDGDTEEIETVLSSNFYRNPSLSYSSKIEYLKTQCTGLSVGGVNPLNCTSNSLDRTHADYDANFLYDKNSFCTYGDISQQILCSNYIRAPTVAPNDCNSPSLTSCPGGTCPICQPGETYCFKNGINCNSSSNQKYPICSALKTLSQPVQPSNDEYVSWFFRPTIDSDAIRELSGAGGSKSYALINMSGYPANTVPGGTPSDDLYMSDQNLRDNGYVNGFFGMVSGSYILGPGRNMGLGAVGPQNICGMNSDYRNIPPEDFAYFRGGVRTVYGLDDKLSHNVEICIRYRSSTNLLGTCGYRRCYASCVGFLPGLHTTCSKVCGYDVCKTMSIEEEANGSQTHDCSSTAQNFSRDLFVVKNGRNTPMPCSSTYNTVSDNSTNSRVRIYKPSGSSNYICAVLDFKDITLDLNRNGQYFNGSEYFLIPDPNKINSFKKLCVSGIYSESTNTCESGVNTNNEWTKSSVWRTARIIKYIMQPPDVDGNWDHANPNSGINYLDQYGVGPANLMSTHVDNDSGATVNQTIGRVRYNVKRYFEKSDCIRHESKVGAPIFFSVASISDSYRLFLPPLEIEGVCNIASPVSPSPPQSELDCDNAGAEGTDFFKPALKILYGKKGATNSFLSVDPGSAINTNYKLLKITNPASDISADYYIKALNIGITTSATIAKTVFIKKEQEGDQPKLCLYEKISLGGTPPTFRESLIKCVNRKRAQNASINPTSADPPHTHLDFGVKFLKNNATLLSSISDANLHSSIIDANLAIKSFTFEKLIDLKNTDFLKKCEQITGNGFPICVEREECSILNHECVENEKALIIAKSSADPQYGTIAEREVVSNYCKTVLLTKCNFKKGYDFASSNKTLNTSILDGEGFNAPAVRNHYGWFNEFCITSGIEVLDDENKYKYVEALIPTNVDGSINEEIGKCKTMTNPSDCPSCDNTICLRSSCCKIYNPATSDPTVTMRKATSRELGLCYTITNYLKTCPAISYGKNDDTTDTFFVGSSFLGSLLLNPHPSHVSRFNSVITKDGVNYNSNNAEYDVAYGGISSVMGKCVGFYKNTISQNNPTANCAINGTWNSFSNSCALYTCPAKKLDLPGNGANFYGNYISSYDASNAEMKSQAGSNEGYANWNSFTKTGYLKQRATSALCITGYAKKNATPVALDINQVDTSSISLANKFNALKTTRYSREINALYKKISGFSGGIDPSRLCNQLGIWESVDNSCERITCPALNFEKPVDYNAFYMNDYDLAKSGDTLYCAIYSGVSSINKVKIDTGSFSASYVNVVADSTNIAGSGVNNLSIKNSAGVTQSLASNRTYVLEKIPASGATSAYWKILDNSNDAVLRALWIKSGGATFGEGYALRSVSYNYDVDSAKDPSDMHRVTGTCNGEMGFNPIGANLNPEFLCDSNGNWALLKNQCTSDCSAVNGSSSLSKGHGFANWIASKAKVGSSEMVSATQCSSGYLPYPYPPQYDNEGVKGDFGVGASLSSSGSAFTTADVFDGIASTSDGANFVATPNAGITLSPTIGNSYNFKISNLLNAGSQVSGSDVQTSFYLFNNSPLTLNAPTGSIWSKINFSSFGTPDYTNSNNLTETPTCHSEYSKFILGTKCIGKATCSISLSDFLTYDLLLSTPCKTPKYGNGINGEQNNTNTNFGSGGGGGGGNNPGSGGTSAGSVLINGMSGTSYYDKSFHVTPPTLAEGDNKGLKVDLTTADSGQFNGGKGNVQIEESVNNGSTYSITATYSNTGEYSHTISSGEVNQNIYVRYKMIGAGGGGGGSGLTKGTNGANGTKMTGGVFVVKKGTVLKIHVGGGGEAGKTRCRSAGGAFLDPRYINPAIEILEPEKETNFVVKALRGIGSLIISDGWAITCTSTQHKVTTKYFKYCEWDGSNRCNYRCIEKTEFDRKDWFGNSVCSVNSQNNISFKADDTCTDTICFLNEGTGYNGRNVDGKSSSVSCDKAGYSGNVNYTCKAATDITCDMTGLVTVTGQYTYNPAYTFSWVKTCGLHGGETINATSNCTANTCKLSAGTGYNAISSVSGAGSITCKTGYRNGSTPPTYYCGSNGANVEATVSGTCELNYCTLSAGTGYNAIANVSGANNSITCKTGYRNGSTPPTYYCGSNGANVEATVSGTCEANSCTVASIAGFDSTSLAYGGSSAVSANCKSGYSGTVSYGPCSTPGGSLTPTGTCTLISACDIPAGNGHTALSIAGTAARSGSITCSGTGYSGASTLIYDCAVNGTPSYSGNCTCATGYSRSGAVANTPCTANACAVASSITGFDSTSLAYGGSSAVSANCISGYSGTVSYGPCLTPGGSLTPSGTCTLISVCNIPAGNGHTALSIAGTAARTGGITCSGTGYSGASTLTYDCAVNGTPSYSGNCTCATGYSRSGAVANTPCTANACAVASIAGFDSTSLAYGGSSAVSANCISGYSGTVSYGPCLTPGGSITPSSTCTLISACSISAGNGHLAFNISATAARTGVNAQNQNGTRSATVDCQNTGGYSGGNASFSCNDSGILTAGNCACATGYSRVDSTVVNSPCIKTCTIPSENGYPGATLFRGASSSPYCSGTAYLASDRATFTCNNDDSGNYSVTNYCDCASGYDKKSGSNICEKKCTISGVGYSADGPNASSFTGIGSGSFTCFTGYAGTINYTCTGATSADLWGSSCSKISCAANSGIAGIQSSTIIAYSSADQAIYCNDPLYINSYTATFPACTFATNLNAVAGKNYCQRITCDIPANKNVTTASIVSTASPAEPSTATKVNLSCKAGYYQSSATLTASCASALGPRSQTDNTSVPMSGSLDFNGTCSPITCKLARSDVISPPGDGGGRKYVAQNNLAYTGASPDKTFPCNADNAGYVGEVTYNCDFTTNGQSATRKSDTCKRIKCKIANSAVSPPQDGSGYEYSERTDLDYTGPGVFKTFPCNAGYVGEVTYQCDFTTDGKFATNVTDNCQRIKCTIGNSEVSSAEHGSSYKYVERRDLDYTGASPAKTISCNTGYYGYVTYICNYTTNGEPATIISDNCRRIKCDLPALAFSNIVASGGQRTVDYAGINLDGSLINKPYTCQTGYEQPGSYAPSYTCVGNVGQTNPATLTFSNACTRIKCTLDGTDYDFGESTVACPTSLGLYGNKIFNCNTDHSITVSQTCNNVACTIPNSGPSLQNSAIDGNTVLFTSSLVTLDCKNGYYSSNRPQYTCLYDVNVGIGNKYGKLTLGGNRCERITCNLPTSGNYVLNSILDNDPSDNNPSGVVFWNGSDFISTTCKEGFYMSNPTNPPKYSCNGGAQPGIITTINSCSPVTCDIADRVGMFEKNNLEYGVDKTTSCNKPGYSGLVTYTCGGAVSSSGKGTLSNISSTCKESSCDREQNNLQTFNSLVGTSDQAGGAGGKILADSTFLKGGDGGSASNLSSVTSGSGGGGGSASMISIDNRIVAIVGGGGGGAGGGIMENTYNASTKSNNYDLDQTLLSNVFGPYLVAEMQYSSINGTIADTAGILYKQNIGNNLSINAPPGMFINDIFLASSGNPNINFSDPTNLILKHGSCNNLQGLEEMSKCLGKESCSFTVDQSLSCPSVTPNFGVVASYYFQEPTLSLKINPPVGSVLINSPLIKITQLDSLNRNFIAANNIKDNVVYTFSLLKNETWAKFHYLSDQYYIPENPSSANLRVIFHRENTTLSPQLKIGNVSLEIKKDTGSSLTIGYIKPNIEYVLRKKIIDSVEYWTIRPYILFSTKVAPLPENQREKPKRTCMTNLFSAGGGVNVIWSRPNSYCVSKCPGFADDNRIGVGATQHTLSNGVTAIAKWEEGNMGSFSIQRFTGEVVDNSNEDGGGKEFTKDSTAFDTNVFKKPFTTNKFILARFCDTNGTWSDPISLCEISNSTTSKTAPIVGATSYINSSTSTWGGGYSNFMQANTAHTATSSCLDDYGPEFTGDIFQLGDPVFSTFKYKCVLPEGGKVDQVYFEKLADSSARDCIKSCRVGGYFTQSGYKPSSISFGTKSDYRIKNTKKIELECELGYMRAKINSVRPTDGTKPTVTCSTTSDYWDGVITNPCTAADRCLVSDLTKDVGSARPSISYKTCFYLNDNGDEYPGLTLFDINQECPEIINVRDNLQTSTVKTTKSESSWFPAVKFLESRHRLNGMDHGARQDFALGKCGYCKWSVGNNTQCSRLHNYVRKYLQSYSCNDGAWTFNWNHIDPDYEKACDGDSWDYDLPCGEARESGENHPSKSYLGGCQWTGDNYKTAAFSFNNLGDY